jgi:hypothetical protein
MKVNPELSVEDVLKEVMGSDQQVKAVNREMSAMESAEATVAMKAAFADHMTKVRTMCIGCEADVPLFTTKFCVCGGFVCEACQKIEVDGECNHERPAWIPSPDEDDE